MSLKLEHHPGEEVLTVTIDGKLEADDYKRFVPVIEDLVKQHQKIDILLILHDFDGWTAGALWEDIKFGVEHFRDIQKLVIVGERKWEKGMAKFCEPFTAADVRFFERVDLAKAREWVGYRREATVGTS